MIDFSKGNGLVPVIIQDNQTLQVLMLGYMNREAYDKTCRERRVTFFSRSKNRLWTKGETSGNSLGVESIMIDCDGDTLLITVHPAGPVCHTGSTSCFGPETTKGFIYRLQSIIKQRIEDDASNSYTNSLFRKGVNKVAQKVGEEAVELVIEAIADNREQFVYEAADLLYHYLILLKVKDLTLEDIEKELKSRSVSK